MGIGPGIAIRKDRKPPKSRLPIPNGSASSPPRHTSPNSEEGEDKASSSESVSTLSKSSISKSTATATTESVKAKIRRPYETDLATLEKRFHFSPSFIARPTLVEKTVPSSSSSVVHPAIEKAQANANANPIKPLPTQAQPSLHSVNLPADPLIKNMSYTLPHSHVCSPCTLSSLTHRLSCDHLVLTAEPTQICAGNCADSGANTRSLYSIPTNPKDLDLLILCPQCGSDVKRESKGFGWGRRRGNVILSQLIHESVVQDFSLSTRAQVSRNGKDAKDGDAGDQKPTNPLNFSFPGCTPVKKKNDSAMFMPGEEKAAERPPRPRRIIHGKDGVREFKLPALAAE